MKDRVSRRRVGVAVVVSVTVHALAAVLILSLTKAGGGGAIGDAAAERPFLLELARDEAVKKDETIAVIETRPVREVINVNTLPGRPPVMPAAPQALSDALRKQIRDIAARPANRVAVTDIADVKPAVVEQPASRVGVTDVVPAAATTPTKAEPKPLSPAARQLTTAGQRLHGPLADKKVVYVLDRSTSMADEDTFAAARGAVLASMTGGSFRVLTYNGSAEPLLPGVKGWLADDEETRRQVAEALAAVRPEGRSDHTAAVRAALVYQPDFVILISDAEDDELAGVKAILRGAEKKAELYLARARGGKVAAPVAVK